MFTFRTVVLSGREQGWICSAALEPDTQLRLFKGLSLSTTRAISSYTEVNLYARVTVAKKSLAKCMLKLCVRDRVFV